MNFLYKNPNLKRIFPFFLGGGGAGRVMWGLDKYFFLQRIQSKIKKFFFFGWGWVAGGSMVPNLK